MDFKWINVIFALDISEQKDKISLKIDINLYRIHDKSELRVLRYQPFTFGKYKYVAG